MNTDAITEWMQTSLDALVRLIERVAPGMRGSVLLLDDDGVTLRHGAAPHLPEAYRQLIDGEHIGPAAGSCGTAAFRRERVIVRDIATDPLWADYKQAAQPFGLAACWSTPILDSEGRVLGTFAMYYNEPREPTAADIELTETATLLSANIITRARSARALRSSQRALEEALAETKHERQRLYEVFMQAPAAITVLEGPKHIFTVANPFYEELIGGRDVIGKPVREALPDLVGQGFFELLDAVFESGQTHSERERVVRLQRNDGKVDELYVDFVYQPLADASGSTIGILVHAVDVTSQVRAREEIATARAEAERANKAKSEFLAAMSHDLRTPLNSIGGYADLAGEGVYGPVTDPMRAAMGRIRRASNHLLSLINDILSFSKIEAGRIQLRIADVSVSEVVSGAAAMIEPQAAKKGLNLVASGGAEELQVRADRERLTQILTNLLTNAVKFTTAGSITVEWQPDDKGVCIAVRDTGRGIATEKLAAVFEPFVQAGRSAEERQQGVGLGLAISRELARAMGGDLTVTSVVGDGSTFSLRIPRAQDRVSAAPESDPLASHA